VECHWSQAYMHATCGAAGSCCSGWVVSGCCSQHRCALCSVVHTVTCPHVLDCGQRHPMTAAARVRCTPRAAFGVGMIGLTGIAPGVLVLLLGALLPTVSCMVIQNKVCTVLHIILGAGAHIRFRHACCCTCSCILQCVVQGGCGWGPAGAVKHSEQSMPDVSGSCSTTWQVQRRSGQG
jgi:hypothetical protein